MDAITKPCGCCNTNFTTTNSRQKYCSKGCNKKMYAKRNREKILEKKRRAYQNNKEKFRQQNKEYYLKNAEKIKANCAQYYQENREQILERQKQYYAKNKDKYIAYTRADKEKKKEYNKMYRQANKQKISNYRRKYYENNKQVEIRRALQYYKRAYEECEQCVIRDTPVHQVFDYLNCHPDTSRGQLMIDFYDKDPTTIGFCYFHWLKLTYEKYITSEDGITSEMVCMQPIKVISEDVV